MQFAVPNELRKIDAVVTANIRVTSQAVTRQLKCVETFKINVIDDTDSLADLHLIPKGASGFV